MRVTDPARRRDRRPARHRDRRPGPRRSRCSASGASRGRCAGSCASAPGTKKFVRLTELTAIPNGTEIDARKGRVLITVLHDASGRLDAARFYAGRFFFNQGKGATPDHDAEAVGRLVRRVSRERRQGPRSRPRRGALAAARARRSRCASSGATGGAASARAARYGAATVRGTKWLTQDRCDGTRVKVVRGKVDRRDLVRPKRKPKRLNAGDAILIGKAR